MLFKWIVIKSNREVHLLPPDPIDISVDHFDWNSDFNQGTVESDYLRSLLSHLMKGRFLVIELPLHDAVSRSVVRTSTALESKQIFAAAPGSDNLPMWSNHVRRQQVYDVFPPLHQLSHQGYQM